MTHEYLLWIALAAYSVHVLEELSFNWKEWANSTLGLKTLEWNHFYVANSVVMFIAIAAAMVGWKLPAFGLIIAALMYVNGIFFHILPTIVQRKISPGVITATVLFLPVASWIYYGAYLDGVLSLANFTLSLVLGGLLMASPIVFIKLNQKLNPE
ncbi:HXXEE domain-containing protein [Francisella sp. SYW-2]|uniref:HXXEE domain-containing protein n=1 Tax=Francisella sp. SYW-2 TaxID=2610886 RepID=UPI00123C816E|nr:HXXEE domain-containing protein [Francisella sp. SYW-2]